MTRRFFCLLILPIVIASFCSLPNSYALRAGIENDTPDLVAAGMEADPGAKMQKMMDIRPPNLFWENVGNIYPRRSRLMPAAVRPQPSNGNGSNGGKNIFPHLMFYGEVRGLAKISVEGRILENLPKDGLDAGNLFHSTVSQGDRASISEAISERALKARARVRINGVKGRLFPMEEANLRMHHEEGTHMLNFQGRIPLDAEHEGDHPMSIEVFVDGDWYLLLTSQEGWIRIDPPNPANPDGGFLKIGVLPSGRDVQVFSPEPRRSPEDALRRESTGPPSRRSLHFLDGTRTSPAELEKPTTVPKPVLQQVLDLAWEGRGSLAPVGADFWPTSSSGREPVAVVTQVRWAMPRDVPSQEMRWLRYLHHVRTGVMRDPEMTIFVLEAPADEASRAELETQAAQLISQVKAHSLWSVVGGDGMWRLFIAPRRSEKAVAPEEYWRVKVREDQYLFMNKGNLEKYGYKQEIDLDRPDLKTGDPVLPISFNWDTLRGLVRVPDLPSYHDPDLEARLTLSYQLVGLASEDPTIAPILDRLEAEKNTWSPMDSEVAASEAVMQIVERMKRVSSDQEFVELMEIVSSWRTFRQAAFNGLNGQVRDQFNAQVDTLVGKFLQEGSPLIREKKMPKGAPAENRLPGLVAVAHNPAQDIVMEIREKKDGAKYLQIIRRPGTYPLNLAQAVRAQGVPTQVVMVGSGEIASRMVQVLEHQGVEVSRVEGPPLRSTLIVVAGEGPGVRLVGQGSETPVEAVELIKKKLAEAVQRDLKRREGLGSPPVLAFGERVYGAARKAMSDLIHLAREGFQAEADKPEKIRHLKTVASANRAWDEETWSAVLEARPTYFETSLADLIQFLRWQEKELQTYRSDSLMGRFQAHPEEMAYWVDQLRRQHGISKWFVPFPDGSMVSVTGSRSLYARQPYLRRRTYESGKEDIEIASALRSYLEGEGEIEAAEAAVAGGTTFMERKREKRGRLPSFRNVSGFRHRTVIDELVRPVPAGPATDLNNLMRDGRRRYVRRYKKDLEDLRKLEIAEISVSGLLFDEVDARRTKLVAKIGISREVLFEIVPDALGSLSYGRTAEALGKLELAVKRLQAFVDWSKSYRTEDPFEEIDLLRQLGDFVKRLETAAGAEQESAQTGKGILVVPEYLAVKSGGLRKFLARLSDKLASEVVLWGEDPLLDRLEEANPALRRFRGTLWELGSYLERLLPADRLGVLADQETVAVLAPAMRRFGLEVRLVHWNLTEILEVLGDPQGVSSQMDLDGLAGELFTESGT